MHEHNLVIIHEELHVCHSVPDRHRLPDVADAGVAGEEGPAHVPIPSRTVPAPKKTSRVSTITAPSQTSPGVRQGHSPGKWPQRPHLTAQPREKVVLGESIAWIVGL